MRAAVVRTTAKAETAAEQPEFLKRFAYQKGVDDVRLLVEQLAREGYTHFANATAARVTVGDLRMEWRILSCGVFFKEPAPRLEQLQQREFAASATILEIRKFYSDMSSIGKSVAQGVLAPDELKAWADFFEVSFDTPKPIAEFFS